MTTSGLEENMGFWNYILAITYKIQFPDMFLNKIHINKREMSPTYWAAHKNPSQATENQCLNQTQYIQNLKTFNGQTVAGKINCKRAVYSNAHHKHEEPYPKGWKITLEKLLQMSYDCINISPQTHTLQSCNKSYTHRCFSGIHNSSTSIREIINKYRTKTT